MEDFEKLMKKTVDKYMAEHPEYVEQMSQAMFAMMLTKMEQALESSITQTKSTPPQGERIKETNHHQRRLTREEFLCLDEDTFQDYNYHERADVSELYKLGYSVSKENPLSDRQRQELLELIIRSGKMSKDKVLSHLLYLIKINGKSSKNDIAVGKWQKDYDFVLGL